MTSRDIERSASTLGRLAAVLLLSGCAALRLDVVPLPPGACPADPPLKQTLVVFVDPAPNRNARRSANASQLTIDGLARVHTDRARFSGPAPTLDAVAELPADVQAAERVYASPGGNSPEGRSHGGNSARFSAESAREAIKLWWAVNEIGRQARLRAEHGHDAELTRNKLGKSLISLESASGEMESHLEGLHVGTEVGLISKPSAAARRLRAATLRWRCCSS